MSKRSRRVALIHATPVAVDPVMEAFRRLWPEAEPYNLLEDSLASDLERAGGLDDAMVQRFRRLAGYAADCGADGILFTCSAFGPAIEAAARDQAPRPVLKPNQAMFADALALGPRIAMVATFAPSLAPMEKEFADMAAAAGSPAQLTTVCVPDAMAALRSGDADAHNRLVADAARDLGGCDAILLAQFSTAKARDSVAAVASVPVLTSPDSAVSLLRDRL
ncbi:aspartate/glutamate racemase family protein [Thalassobaculum sp.]|uniref:aspartate/glutamate racemase family protein n=1 Tax=Thalassobaculum sp. TaxID=2022740 RepID=UPI0032F04C06